MKYMYSGMFLMYEMNMATFHLNIQVFFGLKAARLLITNKYFSELYHDGSSEKPNMSLFF